MLLLCASKATVGARSGFHYISSQLLEVHAAGNCKCILKVDRNAYDIEGGSAFRSVGRDAGSDMKRASDIKQRTTPNFIDPEDALSIPTRCHGPDYNHLRADCTELRIRFLSICSRHHLDR